MSVARDLALIVAQHIIDQISIDPRLTYFAEQQLARRLNELTKSNLKRVRVRARRPDA